MCRAVLLHRLFSDRAFFQPWVYCTKLQCAEQFCCIICSVTEHFSTLGILYQAAMCRVVLLHRLFCDRAFFNLWYTAAGCNVCLSVWIRAQMTHVQPHSSLSTLGMSHQAAYYHAILASSTHGVTCVRPKFFFSQHCRYQVALCCTLLDSGAHDLTCSIQVKSYALSVVLAVFCCCNFSRTTS